MPTPLKQQRNAVKFVYLHSDDSINVNLTEESKGEIECFTKLKADHIHLNHSMFLWISNQEKKVKIGY